MAISFINKADGTANYTSSVTVSKPTSTADGDCMIAFVGGTRSSAPSGWTLLGSAASGTSSLGTCYVYWKVASGEGSSYTFNFTGGFLSCATILTYRGTHASAPVDTTDFSVVADSGTDFTTSSITADGAQWAVTGGIGYEFGSSSTRTWTAGTGSERTDHAVTNAGSPDNTNMAVYDSNAVVVAGAFTRTQTRSASAAGGMRFALLINPAAVVSVATPAAGNATVSAVGNAATVDAVPFLSETNTTDATYNFYIDWNNDGDFDDADENVSAYVLASGDVTVQYGRDGERSLSAISAGSVDLELDNRDGRFSPDNPSTPLADMLLPGRQVKIETVHLGITRTLFRGYIDEYELIPDKYAGTVKLTVLDMLNKLSAGRVSTIMYPSVQTGEAVGILLDAIGWPAGDRDIDSGATTLRWWFAEETDALAALGEVIGAEGPPALAYVEGDTFVFRDRHHRLTRSESSVSQQSYTSGDTEPAFSAPMTYNIGWKDLANQVVIPVEENIPDLVSEIFSSEDAITMTSGQSIAIKIDQGEGFVDLLTPVEGLDYVLVSGAVTMGISRTSGASALLEINCQSAAVIAGLKVRGRAIIARNTISIEYNDVGSQDDHGIRTLDDADLEVVSNQHDAWAIANIIVAQRAQRRPVVTITVNNGNDTRYYEILGRQVSDRIRITEGSQTFVDHEFFIERVEHSIAAAGKDHRVVFTCERAPSDTEDPDPPVFFTFGDASAGFNEGAFAETGISFTETIMILDDPANGALGTGGLGW